MCCHGHTTVISIQYRCTTKYFELLLPPLLSIHSNALSFWDLFLCRLLCQSWQHYTLRPSCTLQFRPVLTIFGYSPQIIIDASKGKYENPLSESRVDNMWALWRAHRPYECKRYFSWLSERARSERDWLFLTNLNDRSKQCCWNWEMSYDNWKFDRNPSIGVVTRTWRLQLSVAATTTDPL